MEFCFLKKNYIKTYLNFLQTIVKTIFFPLSIQKQRVLSEGCYYHQFAKNGPN